MSLIFLPEILVRILCHLKLHDLSSAARVNELFYSCTKIQAVQYHISTQAALLEDNPSNKLDVWAKLGLLKSREDGWAGMSFDWCRTVKVEHQASNIWYLTSGVFFLGNTSRRSLHYFRLPSANDDLVEWSRIDMDHTMTIVDLGLNIYEHDLIAIYTSKPHPSQANVDIYEVHLRQFSTGRPHPLAQQPLLFAQEETVANPAHTIIEIVGDHLAFATTYSNEFNAPPVRLYFFDWRTGALKMDVQMRTNSLESLVFLSPTLLLLPNFPTAALDVSTTLPSSSVKHTNTSHPQTETTATPHHVRAPRVQARHYCRDPMLCQAKPDALRQGALSVAVNFTAEPDDAVLSFQMQLYSDTVREDFAMFVHWGKLREMAEHARSEEGKSVVAGADVDHHMDTNTNTSASASADPILRVPWERWGPRTTRWVDACGTHLDWMTCSWGARSILSFYDHETDEPEDGDVDDGAYQHWWLQVYDLNPYTVRKFRSAGGGGGDDVVFGRKWGGGAGAMDVEVVEDWTTLDGLGLAFSDPVRSALPFVRSTLFTLSRAERRAERARARARADSEEEQPEDRWRCDVDGALMDEEHLLGLVVGFSVFLHQLWIADAVRCHAGQLKDFEYVVDIT
ncbi:hypothetical protein DXG03_000733 [Asterophora parasitica]|uniref:F-box domain-containing protein n=1 Tax=Asterophora parasitica TaxID=117018 RepID=A0A9P7GA75_9AGAR|nr:hypothetical protein DXG03_000733 [Asterophora parasitica]